MKKRLLWTGLVCGLVVSVHATESGEPGSDKLFVTDLGLDGATGWREMSLSSKPTRYVRVDEDGRQILMGRSHDGASALYLPMRVRLPEKMHLTWRWKVTRALPENRLERQESGDDYAARVLVTFDRDLFSRESRTLCYVWASTEAVGSLYESPYSRNVATIVVESGTKRLGGWVMETKNIVDDYRRAFGSRPHTVLAVAVIVDTDNTGSRATAWFSDIGLHP